MGQGRANLYLGIVAESSAEPQAASSHFRDVACQRPYDDSALLPVALSISRSLIPRACEVRARCVDNQDTMRWYGAQCVVWQTATNPVVALELLANGTWSGAGVLGPEAFDALPFLDLLAGEYGSPWGMTEMSPST